MADWAADCVATWSGPVDDDGVFGFALAFAVKEYDSFDEYADEGEWDD